MSPKILGLAGWSGAGKTTLGVQLIAGLAARGRRVSSLKHAHHAFDVDQPGKDSYRHRAAGAGQVLITSPNRWALMDERRGAPELSLGEALAKLDPCDLVLVEGFKQEDFPKLEVHRPSLGKPLLHGTIPGVIAIASDQAVDVPPPAASHPIPESLGPSPEFLDLSNIPSLLAWVEAFCGATE